MHLLYWVITPVRRPTSVCTTLTLCIQQGIYERSPIEDLKQSH